MCDAPPRWFLTIYTAAFLCAAVEYELFSPELANGEEGERVRGQHLWALLSAWQRAGSGVDFTPGVSCSREGRGEPADHRSAGYAICAVQVHCPQARMAALLTSIVIRILPPLRPCPPCSPNLQLSAERRGCFNLPDVECAYLPVSKGGRTRYCVVEKHTPPRHALAALLPDASATTAGRPPCL